MIDESPTGAELLEAWRDAKRAADLADRLTAAAAEAVRKADARALESGQIAELIREAALVAARAAERASVAAAEAAELARVLREQEQTLRQQGAEVHRSEADASTAYGGARRPAGGQHPGPGGPLNERPGGAGTRLM